MTGFLLAVQYPSLVSINTAECHIVEEDAHWNVINWNSVCSYCDGTLPTNTSMKCVVNFNRQLREYLNIYFILLQNMTTLRMNIHLLIFFSLPFASVCLWRHSWKRRASKASSPTRLCSVSPTMHMNGFKRFSASPPTHHASWPGTPGGTRASQPSWFVALVAVNATLARGGGCCSWSRTWSSGVWRGRCDIFLGPA